MMMDRSGLWQITSERLRVLTDYQPYVSRARREALEEMISLANGGSNFWEFRAEYFALLEEMKIFRLSPSSEEIRSVLALVLESSKRDRVGEREWVKTTVGLLSRLARES